jgi:hypothetical protein
MEGGGRDVIQDHTYIFKTYKQNFSGVSYGMDREPKKRCSHIRSHGYIHNNVTKPHVIKRPRTICPTPNTTYVTTPLSFWNVMNFKTSSVFFNIHLAKHFETSIT